MWRVLLLLPLILKDMLHFMRWRQISGCGVLGLQRAAIKRSARATNGARASNTFATSQPPNLRFPTLCSLFSDQ